MIPPTAPILVVPIVKPWHASKTMLTNAGLIVVFVLAAVADAAGIFHLTAEWVAILGIATGAINLGMRLTTNSAIAGTPSSVAKLEPPTP